MSKIEKKIKEAYEWAKHKVVDNGEMTPEAMAILMLGYHIFVQDGGNAEELEKSDKDKLTEQEAKEKVRSLYEERGRISPHYDIEKVKDLRRTYPQLEEYGFWDVYFIMNYVYETMYDSAFPDKLYLKAGARMLEKMESVKHFALSIE